MGADDPLSKLCFRWPWRPSQERVLAAIDEHLADRKLHVVAAPGSGKTCLGIETIRRLGRPALVLSPTRTIRDQWITRLDDFVAPGSQSPPAWVSRDLEHPGFLTSITYQALHTSARPLDGSGEEDAGDDLDGDRPPSGSELGAVARRLRDAGVGTLVLDEAHHLHAEWWKALCRLLEELGDTTIVSLTATPPYDTTGFEWARYQELCGPIDEEISVPELVRAGTLCPHQDYVYMVAPDLLERGELRSYDEAVTQTCGELSGDPRLLAAVSSHPWVKDPESRLDEILDDPELAVAMLVLLQAHCVVLPKELLRLLAVEASEIPPPSRRWLRVLLRAYLFDGDWPRDQAGEQHRDDTARRLRAQGLLWRRELRIEGSRPLAWRLSLSRSKIDGCVEIYRLEREVRGDRLRHVVLTDFIRDDDIAGQEAGEPVLGAWPVFRALVATAPEEERRRMALLTGRIAVLPDGLVPALAETLGDAAGELTLSPLGALPGHARVDLGRRDLFTRAFTELLAAGQLHVLVGTRALLGEGWDAPCVNSLTLASFVGSFVLTNQMRGRAIRTDPADPDKAASIWHLVAVDPATWAGAADLEDLERRCGTFVGLAAERESIESGLERLALEPVGLASHLADSNADMAERLRRLAELRRRWHSAIEAGVEGRVLPSVLTSHPPTARPLLLLDTLRYLALEALFTFASAYMWIVQRVDVRSIKHSWFVWFLIVAFAAAALYTLPKLVRVLGLLLRHLPVDGSVRQIGLALRDALCDLDLVHTERGRLAVRTDWLVDGSVSVALTGARFAEQSLFADCLAELLGPIANPRYLLTRHGALWRMRRADYHAVPRILGINNQRASALLAAWKRRVGPAELIYTRQLEGRSLLLHARAHSFVTAASPRTERRDRWQ